jgi:hypothetical protein
MTKINVTGERRLTFGQGYKKQYTQNVDGSGF